MTERDAMRLTEVIGPPDGWHELSEDAAISNFDNEIVSEIEAALYKGGSYSRHAAWNFNARVWFAEGAWMSQVFVHHAPGCVVLGADVARPGRRAQRGVRMGLTRGGDLMADSYTPKVLDTIPDGMVLVGFARWDGDEFHDFVYAGPSDQHRPAGFDGRIALFAHDPEIVPCPEHDDTEGPHHAAECCLYAEAFDE